MTLEEPKITHRKRETEHETTPQEDVIPVPSIDEQFDSAPLPSHSDTSDTSLAREFAASLQRFGIDPKIVSRFETQEFDRGWDFKEVEPDVIDRQRKEANMFARCVELEEQLEHITIESVRRRHEEEIENLRFELDNIWKERRTTGLPEEEEEQ
ncbi:hypothetical protein PROFUN_08910 [Planoprotostelium fungivorum]|uniref:Uncharacterized protein n=1 Tax=Planoprotostelium fungivorum TaxID=1890364 RepID=A0A2P6NIX0_9EUKA|nr:hypothetical protein PROFUN_08910 [Planoprotostelium fungivorum]